MKLKRYLPLFLFATVISAFVAGQLLYQEVNMAANLTDGEKKAQSHYEAVYKELELETVDGKSFNLKEMESPIVILNFWASWCTPCLSEFPSLTNLVEDFSEDQVRVIGINTDVTKQKQNIEKIQKKYDLNFPIVADEDNHIIDQFLIQAIPVSIIFHNGKVLEVSRGQKDFDNSAFVQKIRELTKG